MVFSNTKKWVMRIECMNLSKKNEIIHYAMPVRGMLYDALSYVDQVSQIKKLRRENKELEGSAEFLSGLKKTDHLYPVITIIFYYGEEKWDGKIDRSTL